MAAKCMDSYLQNFKAKPNKINICLQYWAIGLDGAMPTVFKNGGGGGDLIPVGHYRV